MAEASALSPSCARSCPTRSSSPPKPAGAPPNSVWSTTRPENLIAWTDRSRENLKMETLDLVQLHCPPTDLFYHPEVFATLDDLVSSGAIAHYGVSVERVEEALKAIDYPGVATVQIIYNIFRQRPAARFLDAAREAGVGVIVRVPLASGLLTGKMTREHDLRRGRPPQLQPPRRGLRRRRDLLGRRPRDRPRGRRRAPAPSSRGRDARGVRPPVLLFGPRGVDGDPGGERTPSRPARTQPPESWVLSTPPPSSA